MTYLREIAVTIREEVNPRNLPQEDTQLLFDLYAVLALAVGESITADDVHNAWVAWMMQREPDHPSLVPFDRLDRDTAAGDEPFVDAIRSVATHNHR